jgi:hypothetical protein
LQKSTETRRKSAWHQALIYIRLFSSRRAGTLPQRQRLTGSSSLFRVVAAAEAWVPGIDFRAVRQRISMTEVLALIGFKPQTASGSGLRGPCPIHRSQMPRSRSFAVQVERKVYRCFGCGSAGNHLDLYAAATQQDLYPAALDLCARVHLPIPWIKIPS